MATIQWDKTGERIYETGVDRGVLYIPDAQGAYSNGYAWNGLTSVSESPSGAEANPQYADNIKYLNLISTEEFGATIEAFTYPDEFAQCDGTAVYNGIQISQQVRKSFGFSYRTLVGNDLVGTDFGFKIHLVYGCDASPSEKTRSTVNDSPEAATFSWEVTTNPVPVPGVNPMTNKPYRPTSHLVIDSTKTSAEKIQQLEEILYGTSGAEARMPMPDEVLRMFEGSVTEVTPTPPTFDETTDTVTVPTATGVRYLVDGNVVTGSFTVTEDTIVTARPEQGFKFPAVTDADWMFSPA